MPVGVDTRETNNYFAWGRFEFEDNDSKILALGFEPTKEEKRFFASTRKSYGKASQASSNNSRSSAKVAPITEEKVVQLLIDGVWIYKPIALNVCEDTLVNRIEDTGKIPRKIFNMSIGRSLAVMSGVKGTSGETDWLSTRRLVTSL